MVFGFHQHPQWCAESVLRPKTLKSLSWPLGAGFMGPTGSLDPLFGARRARGGPSERHGHSLQLGQEHGHADQVVGGGHQVAGQSGTVHAPVGGYSGNCTPPSSSRRPLPAACGSAGSPRSRHTCRVGRPSMADRCFFQATCRITGRARISRIQSLVL